MAYLTATIYGEQPTVKTSDFGSVIVKFSPDHFIGLSHDEAVTLAADLLDAADKIAKVREASA